MASGENAARGWGLSSWGHQPPHLRGPAGLRVSREALFEQAGTVWGVPWRGRRVLLGSPHLPAEPRRALPLSVRDAEPPSITLDSGAHPRSRELTQYTRQWVTKTVVFFNNAFEGEKSVFQWILTWFPSRLYHSLKIILGSTFFLLFIGFLLGFCLRQIHFRDRFFF